MTIFRLQLIDQAVRHSHTYLKAKHKCYFLREYTAGQGYKHGETNQLIINLKKEMSLKDSKEWKYKEKAICQIAKELSAALTDSNFKSAVFVPMPPSKVRSDPEYDPRLILILKLMNKQHGCKVTISDCASEKHSRTAAHSLTASHISSRPPPEKKMETLILDHNLLPKEHNQFVIFDDMITTGSSYVAMYNLLQEARPDAKIYGLFVARRVPSSAKNDFESELKKFASKLWN